MATTASLIGKATQQSSSKAPGPDRRTSLKLLIELQQNPTETLQRLTEQYGGVVRLQPGLSRLWIISDPQYLQRPLYENAANYARAGLFRSLKPALGDGLMVSSNDDRDGLHELLSNAFQPRRLKQLSTTIQACVQWRAAHWLEQPATPHNLVTETQQLSLDILCQLLFGPESNSISRSIQPLLATAHRWMDSRSDQTLNSPGWLPTSHNRHLKAAMQQLDAILSASLEHARPRMRDADTLLELLVGLRAGGGGEPLSTATLLSELRGLLLLAQRNLASALFSSSWLLANDTSSQRVVGSEAATIAQRGDDDVTTQAAYSRMVVEESLRLYPPTWAFSRQTLADDMLGDYAISAGSLILYPINWFTGIVAFGQSHRSSSRTGFQRLTG